MLSYGTNITSQADRLTCITLEQLHQMLLHPETAVESTLRQLRIIRTIDAKQYARVKRTLPYVVCAKFEPSFRRIENFVSTDSFCLDIDHLMEKGLDLLDVRRRVEKDPRVALTFVSPSGDGLKVFFRMAERCTDAGLYTLFYKSFVAQFSFENGLEQVIDDRTCDVSRACFLSIDPQAFYRPQSIPIDWHACLPENNPSDLFDLKHKQEQTLESSAQPEELFGGDPDDAAMKHIREMLAAGKHHRPESKPQPNVPPILDEFVEAFKPYVVKSGIQLTEVINIQYAKKLRFKLGLKQAEINVFYGHHGFKVVQSPRGGTSPELNQLTANLIETFLDECM